MSRATLIEKWLSDVTFCGQDVLGHEPCLSPHPSRRLVCDLPTNHDGGHACYPSHYKEPVFWRARMEEE